MAAPAVTCICGHLMTDHVDGACKEPTLRCECEAAIELCPGCRHSSEVHLGGRCLRIVRKTMQPCGCLMYPVVETAPELAPATSEESI